MNTTSLNMRTEDLMKHVTIKVTLSGLGRLRMRLWVAKYLFYLAAWILQCGVKIDMENK